MRPGNSPVDGPALVLHQHEVEAASRAVVGVKAATLAAMAEQGIAVPDFFVISSEAFATHLRENRISWAPDLGGSDFAFWAEVGERIRDSPLASPLSRQVLSACEELCRSSGHGRVAVRSSGQEEDSASTSFAGQFDSFLNLDESRLLDAVKACWASSVSARSMQYRASNGLAVGSLPGFGVIVQTQVFAERAGVMFTEHPVEPALEVVYIEANFGTGESVVGGLVTPDAVTVSRSDSGLIEMVTGTKRRMTTASPDYLGSQVSDVDRVQRTARVLSDLQVRELVETGLHIEELMQAPQDVEWAFDSERLWILQSRPITTPGTSRRLK